MGEYAKQGLKNLSSHDGEMMLFPAELMLTGIEFQRVGAATEKALVQIFVSTLGIKSSPELVYALLHYITLGTKSRPELGDCWSVTNWQVKSHVTDVQVQSSHKSITSKSSLESSLSIPIAMIVVACLQ